MEFKEMIGVRIKEIRKKKAMSQEAVANTAEMERSFITHIENGRRNISVDTLERVLIALKVTPKDFFDTEYFS